MPKYDIKTYDVEFDGDANNQLGIVESNFLIANELAEMNRLKRIEIDFAYLQNSPYSPTIVEGLKKQIGDQA